MTTDKELKACPFCGGKPVEEATAALEYHGSAHQTCWIECSECGIEGPHVEIVDEQPAYQVVRDKWNTRAEQPAPSTKWGPFHHSNGVICCGTLRVARADFDNDATPEVQAEILDALCGQQPAPVQSKLVIDALMLGAACLERAAEEFAEGSRLETLYMESAKQLRLTTPPPVADTVRVSRQALQDMVEFWCSGCDAETIIPRDSPLGILQAALSPPSAPDDVAIRLHYTSWLRRVMVNGGIEIVEGTSYDDMLTQLAKALGERKVSDDTVRVRVAALPRYSLFNHCGTYMLLPCDGGTYVFWPELEAALSQ